MTECEHGVSLDMVCLECRAIYEAKYAEISEWYAQREPVMQADGDPGDENDYREVYQAG